MEAIEQAHISFPAPGAPAQTCWSAARAMLAERLSSGNYKTWIEPLTACPGEDGRLILAGPNDFFLNWVKNNYAAEIREALGAAGFTGGEVLFKSEPEAAPQRLLEAPHSVARNILLEAPRAALIPALTESRPLGFNPRFTFDNFVVGEPNRYAFAAAEALARGDNLGADALFITSDHGLGKSHLSQAMGQAFLDARRGARVYYLTAEEFTNEMTHAIRHNVMEDFKNKYRRDCDVLVLEEVQFLAGKEKIQAELGYTLDCLFERGKKVVFTSPEEPKNIPRLGRALRSRLSAALVSPIGAPDYETRLRILLEKAKSLNFKISRPVFEFIAERVGSDVRQLESSLIGLAAKSRLLGRPADMEMAKETLSGLCDESEGGLTPLSVRTLICRFFQIELNEILSKTRQSNLVEARSIGMYLSRQFTSRTLDEIGRAFGRTHTSTHYAISKLEQQLKKDQKLKGKIDLLTQKLL